MEIEVGRQLVINAPEFFEDPAFRQWLTAQEKPVFTWHNKGDPHFSEWSDVVVLVDPGLGGEGSEADEVPEHIWNQIIEACKSVFAPERDVPHIAVRITNLG